MSATPSLNDFPVGNYVGKPVDSLLKALPAYNEFIFVDNGRPGILGGANFRFDSLWLKVKVGELAHLKRFDENYKWDLELFKQELISGAEWMK